MLWTVRTSLEPVEAVPVYRTILGWAAGAADRFVLLLALDRRQDARRLAALRGLGRPTALTLGRPLGWVAQLFFGPYRYEQREGVPDAHLLELLATTDPDDPCPVEVVQLCRGDRVIYRCDDYARDQTLELEPDELSALEGALSLAGLDPARCLVRAPTRASATHPTRPGA